MDLARQPSILAQSTSISPKTPQALIHPIAHSLQSMRVPNPVVARSLRGEDLSLMCPHVLNGRISSSHPFCNLRISNSGVRAKSFAHRTPLQDRLSTILQPDTDALRSAKRHDPCRPLGLRTHHSSRLTGRPGLWVDRIASPIGCIYIFSEHERRGLATDPSRCLA